MIQLKMRREEARKSQILNFHFRYQDCVRPSGGEGKCDTFNSELFQFDLLVDKPAGYIYVGLEIDYLNPELRNEAGAIDGNLGVVCI